MPPMVWTSGAFRAVQIEKGDGEGAGAFETKVKPQNYLMIVHE